MKQNNLITSFFLFSLSASVIMVSSCNKLLDQDPVGQSTLENTYTDFSGSLAGVNGIYSVLTVGNMYRGNNALINVDLASDDLMNSPLTVAQQNKTIDYFEYNAITGSPSYDIWQDCYTIIYRANAAIERVPGATFASNSSLNSAGLSFKDQFVGEAKFLRAFANFNLVRLFGDVPLRTTEIKGKSEINIARSPKADVYAFIEADLKDAAAKLPATYSGSGAGNEKGRATRWTALAMLADVYLTQKKYTEAKETALLIIQNTSGIRLADAYKDNFVARGGADNSVESLFEIQFSNQGQPNLNRTSNNFSVYMGPSTNTVPGSGVSVALYRPTDNLTPDIEPGFTGGIIQEYQVGDLRLDVNFAQGQAEAGITRWLTTKYYKSGGGSGNENFPVYRFAEILLIYAEATNESAGPDATSINYINQLRRRAFGLPIGSPAVVDVAGGQTQASFRDVIRSERRKELAGENKRFFDLQRYGFNYANTVLKTNQKKTNFSERYMLLPIPQAERFANPLLTQNPGFEN